MTYIPHEKLPKSAHLALSTLHQAGFEAFVVGGWIRDQLLNIPTQDVDLATNAQPQEVLQLFSAYTCSVIGQKHGTIGVKVLNDWVEITTYRSDGKSLDARHPLQVKFVDTLKDDLIRRDFTMNALAMDRDGRIIDWVSGLDDIQARRLRCVGEPEVRFKEDALRIVRALRFMTRLNFRLEMETQRAMVSMRSLLDTISVERIYQELCGIFSSDYPELSFQGAADVMFQVLPELIDTPKQRFDYLNQFKDIHSSLAFLYCDLNEEILMNRLKHLKAPNDTQKEARTLHRLIHLNFKDELSLKKALGLHSSKRVLEALRLQKLLKRIDSIDSYAKQIETWIQEGVCLSIKDLAVDGHDLANVGLKGPAIQHALERLLDEVLLGHLSNEKALLLDFITSESA